MATVPSLPVDHSGHGPEFPCRSQWPQSRVCLSIVVAMVSSLPVDRSDHSLEFACWSQWPQSQFACWSQWPQSRVCLSTVVATVSSLPVDRSGHSQLICHTLLVQLSVYYLIVSATVETYLCWNCQPTFAMYYWSFPGTQKVPAFAYSDLTSRSLDYVLSMAGLFSTKLSLSLAELSYFTR